MTCGAQTTVGGVTLACEMTGHTKPEALGPTHMARLRVASGMCVVIRWPTNPDALHSMDDG